MICQPGCIGLLRFSLLNISRYFLGHRTELSEVLRCKGMVYFQRYIMSHAYLLRVYHTFSGFTIPTAVYEFTTILKSYDLGIVM